MKHTATYSPDDDKIRIYPACKLDKEDYQKVKSAGYRWAPQQKLFFAMWSPDAEDLALEMCGEIEDEDKSLVDRAEERAERFERYSERRDREANQTAEGVKAISENIPFGQPILIGHHSEKRARRDAAKIENGMRKAVQLWKTSEYWSDRAAGAISAAKYKERPDVRARRIKKIEAEIRRITASYTPRNPDKIIKQSPWLCPVCSEYGCDVHPEAKTEIDHVWCGQTRGGTWVPVNSLEGIKEGYTRWLDHLNNRLVYEKAMLNEQGASKLLESKPRPKQLPLLNYHKDGCFTVPNRWSRGSTIDYHQVEMTTEEYRKVPSEYRGTIMVDENHRMRIAIGCFIPEIREKIKNISDDTEQWDVKHKYFAVFLSDSKVHEPPVCQTEAETALDTSKVDPGLEVPQNDSEEKIEIPEEFKPKNADLIIIDDPLMDCCEEKINTEQMDLFSVMKDITETAAESVLESTYTEKEQSTYEQFKEQLKTGINVVTAPQLFPTPPDIAERMVELADIKPGMSVLEPSAGTGNIVRALDEEGGCMITAVEINSKLCDLLRETFRFRQLVNEDFLSCNGNLGTFDRVLMNPPFKNAVDIKHIEKAIEYLKPGGSLVALCANGPRQQKRFKETADLWEELPAGSFKDSGTMVNVALLKITKGEPINE